MTAKQQTDETVSANQNGDGQGGQHTAAAPWLNPRSAQVPWKRAHANIFESSIMEEPYHVRLVFDYMIRKADTSGFCGGTETALARIFNVKLDDMKEAIRILESPDSKSRTPSNDGRRIRKVQGGWIILNHEIYQPGLTGKRVREKENERDNGDGERDRFRDGERERYRDRDSATLNSGATYEKPINPTSQHPSQQALNSWHPSELAKYISLGDAEQKAFGLTRCFAELAANGGQSSFPLALGGIAKGLDCSSQRASKLRESLVDKGVIALVSPYSREANKPDYFRWALETTLPIPPMPESDDEPDVF